MTAKEYLNQARSLDMLINAKQEELYRLKLNAASITSPTISDKVQSGKQNNSMRLVDKIVDLQEEINAEIDKLVDIKAEIRERIRYVYNRKFIALLTDKYINGYTLEQIAERMNLTPKTIYRWHGIALQIFRKETGMK